MGAGDLVPYAGPGARVPAVPEPLAAAGHPWGGLGRDDLFRPRARHLSRSLGDLGPASRCSAGCGLRGDVRTRRRRPGPRDRDQPARSPVGARHRSRGGGCHRRAARSSGHRGRRGRRTPRNAGVRRGRGPRALPPLPRPAHPRRCRRSLAAPGAGAAHRGGDATALGRHRRNELRDARARSTDAPVRPRSVGRTHDRGSPGAGRRAAPHAGRRGARAGRGRPAHRRPRQTRRDRRRDGFGRRGGVGFDDGGTARERAGSSHGGSSVPRGDCGCRPRPRSGSRAAPTPRAPVRPPTGRLGSWSSGRAGSSSPA